MGARTNISWCDHTFNGWIGCTRVSPGCDHCYAETMDARGRWDGGRKHWGPGVPRYRTSASNWAQPVRWDRAAAKAGVRRRVFCASLADVFDNEVPDAWRSDLFALIEDTPHLDWLILTKRIGNVAKMIWPKWDDGLPQNVWLGASVVNQAEADRDIPKLLAMNAAVRFLSCEPLIGPIDLRRYLIGHEEAGMVGNCIGWTPPLDWVIVGGESGPHARAFDLAWARSIRYQCEAADVAFFMKQIGARAFEEFAPGCDHFRTNVTGAGADPAEWPADLRVQEFPA